MKHLLLIVFLILTVGLFAQTKAVGHIFAEVVEPPIGNSIDSSFLTKNVFFNKNTFVIQHNETLMKTISVVKIEPPLKPEDKITYTLIINYN